VASRALLASQNGFTVNWIKGSSLMMTSSDNSQSREILHVRENFEWRLESRVIKTTFWVVTDKLKVCGSNNRKQMIPVIPWKGAVVDDLAFWEVQSSWLLKSTSPRRWSFDRDKKVVSCRSARICESEVNRWSITEGDRVLESWKVNRHIAWCTNPYHVVSQCSLMPGC